MKTIHGLIICVLLSMTGMGLIMNIRIAGDYEEGEMLMLGIMDDMTYGGSTKNLGDEETEVETTTKVKLTERTKMILDYECKEAIITNKEGDEVTYWDTEFLENAQSEF